MQLITNGKTILPNIYTDTSVTVDSQVLNSNETTRYIEFVGIDNNNYESYLNTVFWYKPTFTSTKNSSVSIQFVYNNSLNYHCLIRNPEMTAGNVYALAFDSDDVSGVYLKIISNAASTLQKKTINSETDINTLTADGIYASSFGVYGLVNAPGGQPEAQFLMIVNADIGHSITQIAFTNDEKIYMRTAGGTGDFTRVSWVQVAPAQTTTWTGTLEEYNAITTKDDNTIYYIKE